MKHLLLILLFVGICNELSGMEKQITLLKRNPNLEIQIPTSVIYERLCELNLNSFIHHTKIHEKIGNQKVLPGTIALKVNSEIHFYLRDIHRNTNNSQFVEEHSTFIQQKKVPMIKAILADHPSAIEYLMREGFIKEKQAVNPTKQDPVTVCNNSTITPRNNKFLQGKTASERQNIHWQMFRS